MNLRQSEQRSVGFLTYRLIEQLTRDKDNLLQPVRPTQIALARYGLGNAYTGGVGSGLSITKEVSDGMEDGPGRVHDRHGVSRE